MIKLWHDDVRKPPDDSWMWARTNKEAVKILEEDEVEEASLDHDLGLDFLDPNNKGVIYLAGSSPDGTGYDLVKWMIENKMIPRKVTIHSWSMVGAQRMGKALKDADLSCNVLIQPYEP